MILLTAHVEEIQSFPSIGSYVIIIKELDIVLALHADILILKRHGFIPVDNILTLLLSLIVLEIFFLKLLVPLKVIKAEPQINWHPLDSLFGALKYFLLLANNAWRLNLIFLYYLFQF